VVFTLVLGAARPHALVNHRRPPEVGAGVCGGQDPHTGIWIILAKRHRQVPTPSIDNHSQ